MWPLTGSCFGGIYDSAIGPSELFNMELTQRTQPRNIWPLDLSLEGTTMKATKLLAIATVIALQATSGVWASGPGTTGADILKIGVGARAIGMGEAYTAQSDDVSSLY